MAEPSAAGGCCAQPAVEAAAVSRNALGGISIDILDLPKLNIREILFNLQKYYGMAGGGQAMVYFTSWRKHPELDNGTIPPGERVAIKHIRKTSGGGRFAPSQSQRELEEADRQTIRGQRIELHLLSRLHAGGCGDRIVKPLATFRYAGEWFEDPEERARRWYEPTNGYVMKAYPLGSVAKLLKDICYRRVPESVGQRFLNMRTVSAEYAALLGELHKIHTLPEVKMMIQDLTPGNLLVDDGPEGIRLMLSDPAMAQPIEVLQEKSRHSTLCGTWLWGSLMVRHRRFDPSADLYSLSFIFAEIWLVAEGAVESPVDLMTLMGVDYDRAVGVQFMRHLVWQVLRLHHQGTISIKPRLQRHLPVSWLGAWLLLLGFRDYAEWEHMLRGLPCLRPSEQAMLEAAQLWARISAAAEELPADLSEDQALSPACSKLVDDMDMLLQSLIGLSHLSDAGMQEDEPLAWCAANFLEQKHPLVAALRARGAQGVGEPQAPPTVRIEMGTWWDAISTARKAVRYASNPAEFDRIQCEYRYRLKHGEEAARTLGELGQWYQGLQRLVQDGRIPTDLASQLLPPPSCHHALNQAAGRAAVTTDVPAAVAAPVAVAPAAAPVANPAPAVPAMPEAPAHEQQAASKPAHAASHLPQPATPGVPPAEQQSGSPAQMGALEFLEYLADQAANQPANATGHKRASGTATAAPSGLHPHSRAACSGG